MWAQQQRTPNIPRYSRLSYILDGGEDTRKKKMFTEASLVNNIKTLKGFVHIKTVILIIIIMQITFVERASEVPGLEINICWFS